MKRWSFSKFGIQIACYNSFRKLRQKMMKEQKLLHLLQKKKNFFEAILELSEDEHELSLQEWISVLEQKKILLSCIDEIDAELTLFRESLHDISQEIADELENIRTVIKRILHLDVINQEKRKKDLKPHDGAQQ
jgi:hypothetical protein